MMSQVAALSITGLSPSHYKYQWVYFRYLVTALPVGILSVGHPGVNSSDVPLLPGALGHGRFLKN